MLRFKCSSNNSCTYVYSQPEQPHRLASRTGKWIQLNPSAGSILRNESVYYAHISYMPHTDKYVYTV